MGPQAKALELPFSGTEIRQYNSWYDVPELTPEAREIMKTMPDADGWGTIVNHGTVYGIGGARARGAQSQSTPHRWSG